MFTLRLDMEFRLPFFSLFIQMTQKIDIEEALDALVLKCQD